MISDSFAAPLTIAVAPNGARRTQADHPALPITPDELARTAAECLEAGAAMIHLHVRDSEQKHTLDADAYRAATAAVRREVGDGLIIQVTSEAVGIYTADQQMAMVRDLRPEAVSLAVKEICPDAASEPAAADFLAWMAAEAIQPQYILYSAEDVARLRDLCKRGVVPGDRISVLYVLGRYTKGQVSQPADVIPFIEAAGGDDVHWSVCAFGRLESACAMTAAALGGHVRVGFENNLYAADGRLAESNTTLVSQVRRGAAVIGRPVATPQEARALLF